jgi:hypothetical protein
MGVLVLFCLGTLPPSIMAQDEAMPDPLTLEQSLQIAANSPLANALAKAEDGPGAVGDRLALLVSKRFFDVILADERYMVDNELMTVSFFKANRYLQQRGMFDKYTELQVAEKQSHYLDQSSIRQASDHSRFRARIKLAHAMGRASAVVKEVTAPEIGRWLNRPVPDYMEYLSTVGESNANVNVDALVLREAALDTLHTLIMTRAERQAAEGEVHYRDLYLDKSRAHYDMEKDSDLGQAQANLAAALWQQRKVEYDTALAWMKLDIITKALSRIASAAK